MGIMTLLLPIVLVVGIFFLVVKLNNTKRKRNIFYTKRIKWILGGYVVILLIGSGLAAFIPEEGIKAGKKINSNVLAKETEDLHVAALEGKLDKLDSKWKRKTWHFEYQGKMLNIIVPSNEYSDIQIVAERKGTNDEQIEAYLFASRATINDREITAMQPQIALELGGQQLTIQRKTTKLNYTEFTKVFPIRQFTGEKMFSHSSSFYEGQSVLYLKIPKDLQLNPQENLNFEYVVK